MPRIDNEDFPLPAAAISLEYATLIVRKIARGMDVEVNLKVHKPQHAFASAKNIIGDIIGRTKPQEYCTISGHIDSWHLGQSAMDDAGGAFLAWHSLALIQALHLDPPARTMRAILWTAKAYRTEREGEVRNWTAAFKSDGGVFQSRGIGFLGSDEAACMMQEIASLMGQLNATELHRLPSAGSDIRVFADLQLPMGEPYTASNPYFAHTHTDATTSHANLPRSEDVDQNLAIFAATTYILANLSVSLPKTLLPPPPPLHLEPEPPMPQDPYPPYPTDQHLPPYPPMQVPTDEPQLPTDGHVKVGTPIDQHHTTQSPTEQQPEPVTPAHLQGLAQPEPVTPAHLQGLAQPEPVTPAHLQGLAQPEQARPARPGHADNASSPATPSLGLNLALLALLIPLLSSSCANIA